MNDAKRHQLLKPLLAFTTMLMLVALVSDPVVQRYIFKHSNSASAVGGYNAVDVLGQTDGADATEYDLTDARWPSNRGLNQPTDVAIGNNMLFVADEQNSRVLVFNMVNGEVTDHDAAYVLGQSTFRAVNTVTTDKGMTSAYGVSYAEIDARKLLFVADRLNNRVLVFDITDGIADDMPAMYVIGQPDMTTASSCGDLGGPTARCLWWPSFVSADAVGKRLYVSDKADNRILVFDVSLANLASEGGINGNAMNADYVIGQSDFVTGVSATTSRNLNQPMGLSYTTDGDRLFVADMANDRVLVYDVSLANLASEATGNGTGTNAEIVLGQSDFEGFSPGTTDRTMSNPIGIAYEPNNHRLFVGDYTNERTLIFDGMVGTLATNDAALGIIGKPNFMQDFCTFEYFEDCTSGPSGLALVAGGGGEGTIFLYVAEPNLSRVTVFDATSGGYPIAPTAVNNVGQTSANTAIFTTDSFDTNAGVNERNMNGPEATALDTVNHRLYVADTQNNRVLVYNLDASTNLPLDHSADYVLGQQGACAVIGSEQARHDGYFRSYGTNSIADGFLADCSGAVSAYGLDTPTGLALDVNNQRLFVADSGNNRVLMYDVTLPTSGAPATIVLGQNDFSTNGSGNGAAQLNTPKDVEYDAVHDWLYVADVFSQRVVIYNVSPGHITSGMPASWVLGAPDFGVDGHGGLPPEPDTLGQPEGVTYDQNHNRLFVAENFRDRIAVYDLANLVASGSGLTPQVAVLGQPASTSQLPGLGIARVNFSNCSMCVSNLHMAYDAARDRLIVPDRGNNRILIFNVATVTTGQDAADVIGQTDFDSQSSGGGTTGVNRPQGLAYDPANDAIYATDTSNNRMMVFSSNTATPTPSETPASGGRHQEPPASIGFFPDKIVINSDETSTDSKNVLISVYAHHSADFNGTVDVLLSNTPDFAVTIPFRYSISSNATNTAWPKTIAWDLCFGLPATTPCNPGKKDVYARFYVNLPNVWPALTPLASPH